MVGESLVGDVFAHECVQDAVRYVELKCLPVDSVRQNGVGSTSPAASTSRTLGEEGMDVL